MNARFPRHTWLPLVACPVVTLGSPAQAKSPLRAARLGYVTGTVSFSPAGQPDWVRAAVNRPMTTGDPLCLRASERVNDSADDDLDPWARRCDRSSDNSMSAHDVSRDLVGHEDLDANGT